MPSATVVERVLRPISLPTGCDPLLGDRAHLDPMMDNEAKGSVFPNRARYVKEELGSKAFDQVVAALSDNARRLFVETPLVSAWFPIRHLIDIDIAIAKGPFGGDISRLWSLAEKGAAYDLSALYRFLLKISSPSFVMKRLGVAFSAKVRKGQLRAESVTDRDATIVLTDTVVPYYYCEWIMPAYAHHALSLVGAHGDTISKTACRHRGDPLCRWHVTWES